jgi:hypothetical protein
MVDDDDRLADLRKEAAAAFGLPVEAAEHLTGGNRRQLYDSALRLRQEYPSPGQASGWATPTAALHVTRAAQRERLARFFRR